MITKNGGDMEDKDGHTPQRRIREGEGRKPLSEYMEHGSMVASAMDAIRSEIMRLNVQNALLRERNGVLLQENADLKRRLTQL